MTTQVITDVKSNEGVFSIAQAFAQSGMFPDIKSQAQAVVKILAGQELGFGPVYSMMKVMIVKGKLVLAAEAMGAKVKDSRRYDYTVKILTDTECVLVFTDNGKPVYESHFTMDDAKRADLVRPGGGWVTWPRAMLMSKALSQGARIVCPHVIAGAYTPEDFGIEHDSEGNYQVVAEEPPKAETPKTSLADAANRMAQATPKPSPQGSSPTPYKPKPGESKSFLEWANSEGLDAQRVMVILTEAAAQPITTFTNWFNLGFTFDDAKDAVNKHLDKAASRAADEKAAETEATNEVV